MFHRRGPSTLTALPFDEKTAEVFTGRISILDVPAGQFLCKQGSHRAEIVWILEGHAEVIRDGVTIAEVGPGTVVGEINATHRHDGQTADVVTTTPTVIGVQNLREWISVAHEAPEVAEHVARLAESRLASQAA